MKIHSKAELKALIKECLIEILADAPTSTNRSISKESLKRDLPRQERNTSHEVVDLPPHVPASMHSLFRDSQKRIIEQSSQENALKQKEHQVLEQMASTWSDLAFAGSPATRPDKPPPPPPGHNFDPQIHSHRSQNTHVDIFEDSPVVDDGFDPYEAVKSSLQRRR